MKKRLSLIFYGIILVGCLLNHTGKSASALTSKPSIEEGFSLFLTPHELADLKKQSQKAGNSSKVESLICLQALFYTSIDSWSLWINGEHYSRTYSPKSFKILKVSAQIVDFQVFFEEKKSLFTLKPHQCYNLAQKHVQEM